MHKYKRGVITALACLSVCAFGAGVAGIGGRALAETADTERAAVLHYDFSADNVVGTKVKNSGTKANADGTLSMGTGLKVEDGKLVFDQPGDVSEAAAAGKGYFELPVGSLDNLTAFTLQVDFMEMKGPDDRDPFLGITKNRIVEGLGYGDSNQGVLVGDGWFDKADVTFMENYFSGWTYQTSAERPFTQSIGGVASLIFDGKTCSLWCNGSMLVSVNVGSATAFNEYDYIKLGGMFYSWTGGLQGKFDNVKLYDYARSQAQLTADGEAFFAAQTVSTGAAAKVYYDFAAANEDGTVENLGTGENMDGRIVETQDDVYVQDGKLVINNALTADKTNGYFRLPDNLFSGTRDWTIEMKLDRLDLHVDKALAFLSFSQEDTTTKEVGAGTNNSVQIAWVWPQDIGKMVPFYQGEIGTGTSNIWALGNSDVATKTADEEKTFVIVYKDGVASFYYNTTLLLQSSACSVANYYEQFTFNKIGGYLYDWGRSSADMVIDSFAFYDYARPAINAVAFGKAVEDVEADLPTTATSLEGCVAYDRSGNVVAGAEVVASEVDYTTVGTKEYIVQITGQTTPARLHLTTRDLLAYNGTFAVTSTNPELPEKIEFSYSDGSKETLPVVWENYEFAVGTQTVTATVTDAQGREATATLVVTGERGSVADLVDLIAEIEDKALTSVTSSYNAMIAQIQTEYAAAKAFVENYEEGSEESSEELDAVHEALKSKYAAEKGVLIENAPLKAALTAFGTSPILAYARAEEANAYAQAKAAVENCLEECDGEAARDSAIAALRTAYDGLFVAAEYTGFGGYTELSNGLLEIPVNMPPSNYWSVRQAMSYTVTGNFEFSVTVKDYEKNKGATSWFALTLLTVNGTSVMYEVGLNSYEADAKYPDGSPFSTVNINWAYPSEVDCKAVGGVFPEKAEKASNWYTPVENSEDTFNTANPFTVKIWREAATNRYYFALIQGGVIRYAFYNIIADMSDVYVCLGSTEAEATATDIRLKGVVNPWSAPTNGEAWKGLDAAQADGFYPVNAGDRIYEDGTLVAEDKLYSFDFAITAKESGNVTPGLTIGFVYKSGYIYDKLAVRFGDTTSAEFYLTGSLSTEKEALAKALDLNTTYRLAILINANGPYNILSMYIYDQAGNALFESREYNFYNLQPLAISLRGEGVSYKVSELHANDISGLSLGGLNESIYSPASLDKYYARLEEIGLSVYELTTDTAETLANKIQQFKDAQKLLELAKVIGLVKPFDPIEVELNATKVVLPVRARVKYDNGKEANLVVQWEAVDTSKEGRVIVKGTVYDADGNSTGCIVECPVDIVDYNKKPSENESGKNKKKGCSSSVSALGVGLSLTLFGAVWVTNKKRKDQ